MLPYGRDPLFSRDLLTEECSCRRRGGRGRTGRRRGWPGADGLARIAWQACQKSDRATPRHLRRIPRTENQLSRARHRHGYVPRTIQQGRQRHPRSIGSRRGRISLWCPGDRLTLGRIALRGGVSGRSADVGVLPTGTGVSVDKGRTTGVTVRRSEESALFH